jgi:hypothetical protein
VRLAPAAAAVTSPANTPASNARVSHALALAQFSPQEDQHGGHGTLLLAIRLMASCYLQ